MQKAAVGLIAGVTAIAIGAGSYALFRANAPKSISTRTTVTKTVTPGAIPTYDVPNLSNNAPAAPPVQDQGYNSVAQTPSQTYAQGATGSAPVNNSLPVTGLAPTTTVVPNAPAGQAPVVSTNQQQSRSFYSGLDRETPMPDNRTSTTNVTTNQNGINSESSTTTTTKTAYATPTTSSTTTHYATVHRQVKHHRSGNVHVARALKHTVAFTAKLPGRLRL